MRGAWLVSVALLTVSCATVHGPVVPGEECPVPGRSGSGVPASGSDAAMRNQLKRTVLAGSPGDARLLTLDDFRTLQRHVDSMFQGHRPTFHGDRGALSGLALPSGPISEGSLVGVAGYLVAARAQGPESVNCESGTEVDFHINVGQTDTSSEWNGIVVEIIPQFRPGGLSATSDLAAALGRVVAGKQRVMAVGQLMLDNEHIVNDDPGHPRGGSPKRMSTWELHPVTALLVCQQNVCVDGQPADWTPLEQLRP